MFFEEWDKKKDTIYNASIIIGNKEIRKTKVKT